MAKRGKLDRSIAHAQISRRQLLRGAALAGGMASLGLLRPRYAVAAQAAPASRPAAAAAAVQPQKGGQILIGTSQELESFNPLMPFFEAQRGVQMCIFDSLWRMDPKGQFVPNLAAELPTQANGGISKDGTLFTVKLRKNAKWHDGQPFTAKDVVAHWQTILNPKVRVHTTSGFDQIESMWAADDFTVKFKMKVPYAPIMVTLSDMYITPEHILSKSPDINKDEFNTKRPIGTGPFKFVEWVPGDHVTLEANRAYHGTGPYLDRISFKFTPDLNVLYTQLQTGDVDIFAQQGIPVDLFIEAKKVPNLNLFATPSFTWEAICPNMLLPLFQDKRVRQALYYGMDKKPLIDKVYLGVMLEAETYIPPMSWAYNPKIKGHHKYDPEKAKQLLEQAGWKVGPDGIRVKDGKRLAFENACTTGNRQREQTQQILQQQWRPLGVELTINNKPAAVVFGEFYRMSKFETIFNGMPVAGGDPEISFRLHSKYIPAKGGMGRNSVAYENPKVDQLLDAGLQEMNLEKRKKIYWELQEVLADELPYIPIFHYVMCRGTQAHVQGFRPNAFMYDDMWNANEWWVKKS
jgi:peptide/nickel transport system substrate-binding protein